MNRKIKWRATTITVATLLMFSLHPEIRFLGLFIQAIGVDALILIVGAQMTLVFGAIYHQRIAPLLLWLNALFERVDPFYFMPNRDLIRKCPPIAMHSVPLLVPLCFLVLGHVLVYA